MRQAQLAEAIRNKRAEMIQIGMSKGLDSEETIYCSQELDDLLNEYNRFLSQPKRFNPINDYIDYLHFLHKSTYKIVRLGYDVWGRF
ncbi:Spo0E family sporulation regulatory protein-aspartic acid phosphatase [Neobacillus sp. GCM10023253]|uniref:Spo0E family sporulation regulatory protein-aspartic acid phosphatase n=1 Tax=Neobacillus sp. GCM10023253 TaxID=3252644 RepID=UPI003623893E